MLRVLFLKTGKWISNKKQLLQANNLQMGEARNLLTACLAYGIAAKNNIASVV